MVPAKGVRSGASDILPLALAAVERSSASWLNVRAKDDRWDRASPVPARSGSRRFRGRDDDPVVFLDGLGTVRIAC